MKIEKAVETWIIENLGQHSENRPENWDQAKASAAEAPDGIAQAACMFLGIYLYQKENMKGELISDGKRQGQPVKSYPFWEGELALLERFPALAVLGPYENKQKQIKQKPTRYYEFTKLMGKLGVAKTFSSGKRTYISGPGQVTNEKLKAEFLGF